MTKATKALLTRALELEPIERAELAAELIASLDGEPDADIDAAWAAEIERRMASIDSGTAQLIPWPDVKRALEQELPKK